MSCFVMHSLLFTINYLSFGRASSSVCLGKTALFYCGTLWAFHITILSIRKNHLIECSIVLDIFEIIE